MISESMKFSRSNVVILYLAVLMLFSIGCATTVASTPGNDLGQAEKLKRITGITAYEDAESVNVLVNADQQLIYTSVKQPSPLGVILYFPKTAIDKEKIEREIATESDTLGSIRTSELTEKGHTARIEIGLKRDVTYSTSVEDSGIVVSFLKPLKPAVEEKPRTLSAVSLNDQTEAKPEIKRAETPPARATRLMTVYAMQSDKGVNIKLLADGTIDDYRPFTLEEPARIVFDIKHVNQTGTKEELVPVNSEWVKNVRHFGYPDKVRVVLDTKEKYLSAYSARPVDNGLVIHVGSEAQAPGGGEKAPADAVKAETSPAVEKDEKGISPSKEKPATGVQEKMPAVAAVAETMPAAEGGEKVLSPTDEKPVTAAGMAQEKPSNVFLAEAKTSGEAKAETATETPKTEPAAEVKTDKIPAWVNRIDFSSETGGKSTIIIGTTKPVSYDLKKVSENRLQLKLSNAKLPEYRKRPLVTTRFESAVDRILPFETPALENTSLFSIELREAVPYVVEQADNLILVHFEPSSISPKPEDKTQLPAWEKVVAEGAIIAVPPPPPEEKKPAPAAEAVSAEPSLYTGEKIALDFYETDIKNVFRILREVSKKNFAIDRGVEGKVTLTLERPVPWDQVLDLILKMNGLGMTMEGDIIRIAKKATLDKEERDLKKKAAEERKLLQQEKKEEIALEPLITEYLPINYANASSEVLPKVKPILTPKRGKISVDDRNNQLIITDTAETIEQAKEVVRKIDKVTPQVLIEARIVEAQNTFTRAVGVRWEIEGGPSNFVSGSDLSYEISAVNPPTSALGLIGFNFSRIVGTPFDVIDAQLSASETQGDLNIISAPKILTLNSKKATITQGVRYPYNKLVDGETRTEFINVDLKLEVEPLVTPDQRISMKIFVSNNEIGAVINNAQSFTTKEANTELLVNDGETIVIGGIRKTTKRDDVSGVPVFKDIPVIGWMFKSKNIEDIKEELLIFITPSIVQLEQRSG